MLVVTEAVVVMSKFNHDKAVQLRDIDEARNFLANIESHARPLANVNEVGELDV
jgi:hypothetical protein